MNKRIINILSGIVATVAAISCAGNDPQGEIADGTMVPVTIKASSISTRTTINGLNPLWCAGDEISVFTSDFTMCDPFVTDQGGVTAAFFSGMKPSGATLPYAIYPYNSSTTYDRRIGKVYSTLPSRQDGTGSCGIMMAVGGEEEGYDFVNACCLVKVNIPASLNVTKVILSSDGQLCGGFFADFDGTPSISGSNSSAANSVVIASNDDGFSGDVMLAVLPSTSTAYAMAFVNDEGKVAYNSGNFSSSFQAGHIKSLGTLSSSLTFRPAAGIGEGTTSDQEGSPVADTRNKQQIPNGDFETWTYDGVNLPNNFNSFQTATGTYSGTAYSSSERQVQRSTVTRPGSSGNYSCRIWTRVINLVLLKISAQGNLTSGRISAGSMSATDVNNNNFTDRGASTTNGSATNPCYMTFTGHPDSMVVWVKFTAKSSSQYGEVSADIHDDYNYVHHYKLNDPTSSSYSKENAKHLVASASQKFKTSSNWARLSMPFTYTSNTDARYILINATTSNVPGDGNKNDELYIDDIEMIYNPLPFTVNTGAGGWCTACMDFNAVVPSGASVYGVTAMVDDIAVLKEIPSGSVIPAGTAVLVHSNSSNVEFAVGNGSPVAVAGNILSGVTESTSAPSGCYVLSDDSTSDRPVFKLYSGSTLQANEAYLLR